jgi:N-acetylglucosaminyl-diphospho-decaprenol L-rhamnosyltransferase
MALAPPTTDHSTGAQTLATQRRSRSPVATSRKSPVLSIVIVNYCLWEETSNLVEQMADSPAIRHGLAEIVVVDNHSPPHPLTRRLMRRSGVSLRRWERNRGFARAVNEGCRLSEGEWVLLLNPDISVTPSFLDEVLAMLAQLAQEQPKAGIVGFQLRNTDGSRQLSFGPFPTLLNTLVRLCLPRERRKYDFIRSARRLRVPWVTGCCLLLNRYCLEQLGGLDRDYFLYYEDVDLCRRAAEQGWSVWFEPRLRVTHHQPLHSRPVPAYLRFLTRHALMTYARKHWPQWQFQALALLVRVEAELRTFWARTQRNREEVRLFCRLGELAEHIRADRSAEAQRCLSTVVRLEGRKRAS